MVCISKNKKTQNGDGIIDIIKSAFVESKFPGEMHMPGTHIQVLELDLIYEHQDILIIFLMVILVKVCQN